MYAGPIGEEQAAVAGAVPEEIVAVLVHGAVLEGHADADRNTLFSNCTNELARAAGLAKTPEFVLTGGADECRFEQGFVSAPHFETAQARADLTAWLLDAGDAEFDVRLRPERSARHGR